MTDTASTVDVTTSELSDSSTTFTEVTLSDTDTTTAQTERTADREAVFTEEPRAAVPDESHGEESGYRKVVVVGPSGAGKSSLINLLTDNQYKIKVGSEARGVTFKSQPYPVPSRNIELIDTVGVGEVQSGTVPNAECLENLIELIHGYKKGLHLFVLVKNLAGGSIHQASDRGNYEIFIEAIGRKKVPALLAVTACENEQPMADWGKRNKEHFDKEGLLFKKIVSGSCVMEGPLADVHFVRKGREQMKKDLWDAIDDYILLNPVNVSEREGMKEILRNVLNTLLRLFPNLGGLLWTSDRMKAIFQGAGYPLKEARRLASHLQKPK